MKYLVLLVLLVDCSGKTEKATTAFLEFVSELPKVKVPFEVYCTKCCEHPKYNSDDVRLSKYFPESSAFMGVISQNDKYVSVLVTYPADMIIPSVVIYDINGVKIDEKTFMGDWCDRDIDYLGLQYFIIDKNYLLMEIDTGYSFKMDSLNSQIIDTTDIEISKQIFFVNDQGKITEQ
jgi:hypothetical protein